MAKTFLPAVTVETIRKVNERLVMRRKKGLCAKKVFYFLGHPININMKFDANAWNQAWKRINERHARKAI